MTLTKKPLPPLPEIDDVTRREFLIGAGSLLVLAPFGCGSDGQSNEGTSGETRTATDSAGEEVSIPVSPQRLAVAGERFLTEMAVAFELEPVAAAAKDEFAPFLVDALGDRFDDIRSLGTSSEVNVEALAAAEPDLILVDFSEGEENPVLESAREIAPTLQMQSSAGPRELIASFGQVFGESRAEELNARLDDGIERLRSLVEDSSSISVSIAQVSPEGIRIWLTEANLGSVLVSEAGFSRPNSQSEEGEYISGYKDLSFEKLNVVDGDVLYLARYPDDNAAYEELTSQKLWKSLDVVQRDAVLEVDYRAWNLGGPLAADVVFEDIARGLRKADLAG